MKEVYIEYNPFLVESKITVDGMPVSHGGKLEARLNSRLQTWLDILLPELEQTECNDHITLKFKGTELDYNDIRAAIDDYERRGGPMRISLQEPELIRGGEERLKELIALFNQMQKDCPFDDLKTPEIRKNFERAISAEFEVSVIATMSSGKSTLINALLGQELVPSKAGACTATVAHIKDDDEMQNWTAECLDKNGRVIEKNNHLTSEAMTRYNDNTKITDIYVEGDIPFVSSENMQLVLIDTPGPNNSRTEAHKNLTYRVIKSDQMPMVMYIMNATQLFTNDDESLVRAVAEAIKSQHGKQARDRFIFILNKADTIDTAIDGAIQDTVEDAKKYLAEKGIEDANVYPVSAEVAKVIRMHNADIPLTKMQKLTLRNAPIVFEDMHLEHHAPLSPAVSKELADAVAKAKDDGDEYTEALIHTGIPAVEAAIVEYMNKYALCSKIKDAVDTFKNKIEEKELLGNLQAEWAENDEARKQFSRQCQKLADTLAKGERGTLFRERIAKLDLSKGAKKKAVSVMAKCNNAFNLDSVLGGDGMVDPDELQRIMADMTNRLKQLESDIQTDLEKIVETEIIENAKQILSEYQKQLEALAREFQMPGNFEFDVAVNVLTADIPSVEKVVNQYTEDRTEKVKVGEQWVSTSKWYNPFTWGDGYNEDIFENRKYKVSDGKAAISNTFVPLRQNMIDNINNSIAIAEAQANDFKAYFQGEIDKLDEFLRQKSQEMATASSDRERVIRKLEEDKVKMNWLNEFIQKLDAAVKL